MDNEIKRLSAIAQLAERRPRIVKTEATKLSRFIASVAPHLQKLDAMRRELAIRIDCGERDNFPWDTNVSQDAGYPFQIPLSPPFDEQFSQVIEGCEKKYWAKARLSLGLNGEIRIYRRRGEAERTSYQSRIWGPGGTAAWWFHGTVTARGAVERLPYQSMREVFDRSIEHFLEDLGSQSAFADRFDRMVYQMKSRRLGR